MSLDDSLRLSRPDASICYCVPHSRGSDGRLGVCTDRLDNLRPRRRWKLMAHALDDVEVGIGDCLSCFDSSGKRDQRVSITVDN